MGRRYNSVRWDKTYKVGKPNNGGGQNSLRENRGPQGDDLVPMSYMREIYNALREVSAYFKLTDEEHTRQHEIIDPKIPDSAIKANHLRDASIEEVEIIRLHLTSTTFDADVGRREKEVLTTTLESMANTYGVDPDDFK